MKRLLFFITLLVLVSLACGRFARPVPTVAAPPDLTATPLRVQNEATPTTEVPLSGFDPSYLGVTEKDVTYCTMGGVALKMDVYYPSSNEAPWAVTMYVHGGGWSSGDKAQGAGALEIPSLQGAGFLVVSVNYRLAPEYPFPAMIEDVKCAVRFLRANAEHFNLDPNRIGAYGGSAGGHLVNMLGVTDPGAGFDVGEYLEYSSRVQAVVDMFGPADLTVEFPGGYGRLGDTVFGGLDAALASPVTYVTSDDPPFLILQGDQDTTVPPEQSQIFYDWLVSANVPATLVMVKNAEHGFRPVGGAIDPTREQLTQMAVDFFNQYQR